MQKKYFLFITLLALLFAAPAQNRIQKNWKEAAIKPSETLGNKTIPKEAYNAPQQKAPGKVIFSETFANQIPRGWTVTNNAGNSNNWIWSNTAPGGQYSTTTVAINSTTGSNGFMSLPSDLYNTPFPASGPDTMDTWFTSTGIVIPAVSSVFLRFEQSQRYCCNRNNELLAEVSTDGITWTSFDASLGRLTNMAAPNPSNAKAELVQLDVSAVLANQTAAYLRFRATGNSHYYWMIDDIELVEGASNAMRIEEHAIHFSDTAINPIMSYVPRFALNPLSFSATTFNAGANTQTGVNLTVDIYQDSTLNGTAGSGLVNSISQAFGIPIPSLQRDSIQTGFAFLPISGHMRYEFNVNSDSINQNPIAATRTEHLVISDSILAKDVGPYVGRAGPRNFSWGGNVGDCWASLMTIGDNPLSNAPIVCTSISLMVANDPVCVGSSIKAHVWAWNGNGSNISNALGNPIASSMNSVLIDSSMLDTWINIPISPWAPINANAQYAVGWEQTRGSFPTTSFSVARDQNVEAKQPPVSNYVYINDANPTWGWTTHIGAIRMNLTLLLTGIDEASMQDEEQFTFFPNPNAGKFKIKIKSSQLENYQLIIRNTLGQIVYRNNVAIYGQNFHAIDLSEKEKGIYLISVIRGNGSITKKLIIK